MNKSFKLFFRDLALMLLAVTSFSCGRKDGTYRITILETSDVHGKYFDSLYNGSANKTSLANVSSYFKECDSLYGKDCVLKIDNGDFIQGDNAAYWANYIDTLNDTHLMVKLVDYLGYDALVVGNHDIEAGHPVYDRIYSQLSIPYLAANIVREGTDEAYFMKYVIINKNGIKVAVIGYDNSNIKSWLGENLWKDLDFKDIRECAQAMVDHVNETEKPDVTILCCHAGVGTGEYDDFENPSLYLARNLKGIDALLCGHDHAPYSSRLDNGTVLIDPGARCSFVARLDLEIEVKSGKVISKSIDSKLVPMNEVAIDTDYVSAFKDEYRKVYDFSNRKIGTLEENLVMSDAFFGPSAYLNLIHNVQLIASDARISLTAPLTSKGRLYKGDISFQDLFVIFPYENELYKIKLTGKQIKDYLEYSYMLWIGEKAVSGEHLLNIEASNVRTDGQSAGNNTKFRFKYPSYYFDSAAGINYTVDITKDYGQRIDIQSMADGSAFQPDSTYTVAISSYRANGGGKLITEGAGIPENGLQDILLERYSDIRSMIYDMFINGRIDLNAHSSWKFIPEKMADKLGMSDRKLLFEK